MLIVYMSAETEAEIRPMLPGYDKLEELQLIDKGIYNQDELKTLKYFKVTIEEVIG